MRTTKSPLAFLVLSLILGAPLSAQQEEAKRYDNAWELISSEHDKNKDGKVTKREYSRGKERFARLDTDGDGALTAVDFAGSGNRSARRNRGTRRRDRRIDRARQAMAPKVGAVAPDFTLRTPDGKEKHRLSSFKGKRPVALIFGSYT